MTISNMDDVIDSRDVIARIEELEGLIADEAIADVKRGAALEELRPLKALAAEGENYAPDWEYGAALIRESYFTDYAKELLEDCGDLPRGLPHYIAIDWEATARNIKVDYTEVEFDGVTYLIR